MGSYRPVTPATVELSIDLQQLWSAGCSWDEILPEKIQTKWRKNVQTLNQLLTHEFNRKLGPDTAVGLPEIHGFCNDGEKAYGLAIFLRWMLADGSYPCIPLMIKVFVADTFEEEISSTFRIDGMPFVRQNVQYMQRSSRICRDNKLQVSVLNGFSDRVNLD